MSDAIARTPRMSHTEDVQNATVAVPQVALQNQVVIKQHGGRRVGAGRPHGAQTRATKAQKGTLEALARKYTQTALDTLVEVAKKSLSDSARVAAASALLDRGYGKSRQTVDVDATVRPDTGVLSVPAEMDPSAWIAATQAYQAALAHRPTLSPPPLTS